MRTAVGIRLTKRERRTLEQWSRGRLVPQRQVDRARMILLAADGLSNADIAGELGVKAADGWSVAQPLQRGAPQRD